MAGFLANVHIGLSKKERRLSDNKSLRLHLNARDFSQHKSKMSAGCVGGSAAAGLRVFGAKNCRLSPPGSRPTLTTNQKDNKVSLTVKHVRFVKCKKWYQLLITFTPYGGSSNVTSMYLSPLLAGSRARSCQKKKTKTTYINFDQSC